MYSIGISARIVASYLFRIFPIKKNKIYCSNFYGKGYGDNPKYICEELLSSPRKYEIVWAVRDLDEKMPDGIKKVKYLSFKSIYEASTSSVWIDNVRKDIWFRKRKNQLYIQTWHGGIGFKKIEAACASSLPDSYIIQAKHDSRMIDCLLSASSWNTDVYRQNFWYNGPVLMTGLPRHDILMSIDDDKIEMIKTKLGIPDDCKIALYAPTFRKDMLDYSIYELNWESILKELKNKFGGKWIGAIRLHPGLIQAINSYPNSCIDLSDYPDAQEILAIADILITDYSSVIFDYSLMNKPAFIYATDLDDYCKDREIYFDIKSLPFPYSDTQAGLKNNIRFFNYDDYVKALKKLLYDDCGMYPTANASKNVCNIINNYIDGKSFIFDTSLKA